MRLYDLPRSPWCQQVRVVLAEKGLPYERHIVLPGQEFEPWYTDLNPLGRAPTLVDRDLVVNEAAVINEYLEDAYPDRQLMPDRPAERAVVRMLVALVEQYFGPSFDDLYLARAVEGIEDDDELLELRSDCEASLELLEAYLDPDRAFAAGDNFTLADAALAPFLLGLPEELGLGELLAEYPAVTAYAARLAGRPSCKVVALARAEWAEMQTRLPG